MRLGGNGSSATEGYVEVFDTSNSQWGGICNNGYDMIDAHVICKMLGYPTAIEAVTNSADLYGTAPSGSNFTLTNLACTGYEPSIFQCPLTGEQDGNCEASDIAGVKCSTSKL